jgi:hypothetical protein
MDKKLNPALEIEELYSLSKQLLWLNSKKVEFTEDDIRTIEHARSVLETIITTYYLNKN